VTVQDQIRLWELERNRIKTQDGKLGAVSLSHFMPSYRLLYSTYSRAFRILIHRVRVPS